MANVLELSNIWKRIGKKMIIKNAAFTVESGQIVGLLGPNGAGKTTLIRVMMSLMQLDQGNIMINGYSLKKEYKKAIAQVGGIVENPEFYHYLTGRENLMQYVRMAKVPISKETLAQVVETVHLEGVIDQKVKTYSLGMRQRLGVAQALLHQPALLILDEPMNGLDPLGMREFRETMLVLKKQGVAILVSSHQLSDIQQICDHLVILQNGEVTHKVAMADIQQGEMPVIEVITTDNQKALKLLQENDFSAVEVMDDKLVITTQEDQRAAIAQVLVQGGVGLLQLNQKVNSLEDVFLNWTQEGSL